VLTIPENPIWNLDPVATLVGGRFVYNDPAAPPTWSRASSPTARAKRSGNRLRRLFSKASSPQPH
jgi:hypothetical protein